MLRRGLSWGDQVFLHSPLWEAESLKVHLGGRCGSVISGYHGRRARLMMIEIVSAC